MGTRVCGECWVEWQLTGFKAVPSSNRALSRTYYALSGHFPSVCIAADYAWVNYPQFIFLTFNSVTSTGCLKKISYNDLDGIIFLYARFLLLNYYLTSDIFPSSWFSTYITQFIKEQKSNGLLKQHGTFLLKPPTAYVSVCVYGQTICILKPKIKKAKFYKVKWNVQKLTRWHQLCPWGLRA